MNRREFIAGAAALGGGIGLAAAIAPSAVADVRQLTVQRARYRLTDRITEDMVSLSPGAPPPVLRLRQGRHFEVDVRNATPDYTAMHWHGIRLPNAMDGVPYLTQFPIGENERYRYAFTPPDAGTYWYHPHCMTMNQMARGLTGILVVEEAEDPGFDSEVALNLRDFRLGKDGQFKKLYTARGAARSGTFGNVMTVNWRVAPVIEREAGSLVRVRLAATDTTRIYRLFLRHAEGRVIALDGHPLVTPTAWPSVDAPLVLAPGQRGDVALKMPAREGQDVELVALVGQTPRVLARLRATGKDAGRDLRELGALPSNPVAEPDLAKAEVEEFVFGWSPEGGAPNYGLCGAFGYTFWSINRKPWPGDAVPGTRPLAELKRGRSYILRLRNESPNRHPIHLHGLTFKAIRSNRRTVAGHWTDTALLERNETLDIALVADNVGKWAFHCHVIEHQKSGLAGVIEVT